MRETMKNSMDELLNGLYEKNTIINYDDVMIKRINQDISYLEESSAISDGNHTFDELYHHRMILFAVICNNNKELSWKSRMHSDGYELKNSFIVGVETPEGQFTYHYPLEHWKKFKVKSVDIAPEFDGHDSKDIIRLFSLKQ